LETEKQKEQSEREDLTKKRKKRRHLTFQTRLEIGRKTSLNKKEYVEKERKGEDLNLEIKKKDVRSGLGN